jgi:hypothetical protein
MDLVYIVREGDTNNDLMYSIRSVEKFAPKLFDNIVIVGYKPSWLNNKIKYIPTEQPENMKQLNGWNNVLTACKTPSISDDFILMNDDFILLKPIKSWEESINKVMGTVKERILYYTKHKFRSYYSRAFIYTLPFIRAMCPDTRIMNYELHIPMIFNKKKYLALFNIPEVKEFMSKHNDIMILRRTLYGNYYHKFNTGMNDVKISKDINLLVNKSMEWLSVYEGAIGNESYYSKLTKSLKEIFPDKSSYEV